MYKATLSSGKIVRLPNVRFQSRNHQLETVSSNKICLNSFDDKRVILTDKIHSLPFGHFSIRDQMFFSEIVQEDNWGDSEDEKEDSVCSGAETDPGIEADLTSEQISFILEEDSNEREYHPLGSPVIQEGGNASGWPDRGYYQRSYTESELNDDLFDFSNLTDQESESEQQQNPFIVFEADEDIETEEVTQEDNLLVCTSETLAEGSKQKKREAKDIVDLTTEDSDTEWKNPFLAYESQEDEKYNFPSQHVVDPQQTSQMGNIHIQYVRQWSNTNSETKRK